jgi:hypothetical protein
MAFTAFLPLISKVVDLVIPDPNKAAEAKLKAAEMAQKGELAVLDAEVKLALGQLEINREEAKSANWFVAGGRPGVMWICAFALAYASVIEPIGRFVARVLFGYEGEFPVVDTTITMQILFGILGLGAYRSFEKSKGVAR